jgi:radical SAM superfamily enzyme YgiQ (UPF0313 family)
MRVTLTGTAIDLPGTGIESARYNLAMCYLEAYARHKIERLNINRQEFRILLDKPVLPEDAAGKILSQDPEIVGISTYCWDSDAFRKVVPEIKRLSPSVKIIAGGPSATFSAADMLQEIKEIDAVVCGEGEETFAELIQKGLKNPSEIKGIFYRQGKNPVMSQIRPPIHDLKDIPSPYLSGTIFPPKSNLMMECSRGCVFRCRYCAWKNFMGKIRYSESSIVEKELEWALKNNYNHIFILDSAINFSTKRLIFLAGRIKRMIPFGKISFSYFISHRHFRDEHAEFLEGIKAHEINIGLETINPSALKGVGRSVLNMKKFEHAVERLSHISPVTVSIMLGIPGDTLSGFKETIEYLVSLAHDQKKIKAVRIFWMIVTPGSFFDSRRKNLKIKTAAKGVPYLTECSTFPEKDMREAIRFMFSHSSRELFLWDDANPAMHISGLEDLQDFRDRDREKTAEIKESAGTLYWIKDNKKENTDPCMKIVLAGGTPKHGESDKKGIRVKDFASDSYNYATGLLKASAPEHAQPNIILKDFKVNWLQNELETACIQEILNDDPDVVGFSCYCWDTSLFINAARILKKANPQIITVMGGPSVTYDSMTILQENPHLDIIVRGEGERAFAHLCRNNFKDFTSIKGITYRNRNGEIIENPDFEADAEISTIPSPYLNEIFVPDTSSILIEPSRGCRFKCCFCSWSISRGRVRYAGYEKLSRELKWAIIKGFRSINFCDTALNHDTERLKEICGTIRKTDPERLLSFSIFLRHEELVDEQIEVLKGIKCDEVILGVESVHDEVLKNCGKKPLNIPEFEEKIKKIGSNIGPITMSIIMGLPSDSVNGFTATLDYLNDLKSRMPDFINLIDVFWLSVLPGTRFNRMREKYGFVFLKNRIPYLIRSNDWTSEDLVAAAQYLVSMADRNRWIQCEDVHRCVVNDNIRLLPELEQKPQSRDVHIEMKLPEHLSLLHPWKIGEEARGWILESLSPVKDEDGFVIFRFRHVSSASIGVKLAFRDDSRPCYIRSRKYNIYYTGQVPSNMTSDILDRLLQHVKELIQKNE